MSQYPSAGNTTVMSLGVLLIFILSLLQSPMISGQCMMVPLSMEYQASHSDLIIEGVVRKKNAFITVAGNFIYTTYEVDITKIFKGQPQKSTIQIIEAGGQVGNRAIQVMPSIELQEGEHATFFLEYFTLPTTEDRARFDEPIFRAYASSQSIFSYDFFSNTVAGHFNQFGLETWYDTVTAATGLRYIKVKEINYPERSTSRVVPTISNMSPLSITAGTFSILTITGSDFGATQGASTVEFKNADNGGTTWLVATAPHIQSWSNTQIQLRVPYGGGSGQVRVTVAGMAVISSQSLTITYSQYSVEFNLPPATLFKRHLYNNNGAGGYTFRYHTEFNTLSGGAARKSFERALNSWRCATEVNFIVGDSTTLDATVQDGTNNVRFDNGNEIPSGVGAQTFSYFDDCANIVLYATHVMEIDLVFNDAFTEFGLTWEFGPDLPSATELDFESIALHELGHAGALGHVISAPEVLHYSIGPAESKRVLSANDIAGGTFVHAQSTGNGAWCGNNPMTDYRQVKYVNIAGAGNKSGDSWAYPYKYLQDALSAVTTCVDTIFVATGSYYPDEGVGYTNGTQTHRFTLSSPVVVMGGYTAATGVRNLATTPSTLSGDIDQNNMTDANNSQNVVRISGTATLDGFNIERGYADAASGEGRDGGGIYVSSSGFIRNCVFRNSNALGRGGAVFQSGGSPSFTNCLFYGNTATGSGIAMHLTTGSVNCTNCTMASNTQAGLTALKSDNGTHLFRNSIFWNNTADISITAGSVDVTNSMLQSGSLPAGATGTNVLFNTNPLFVDMGASNFSIVPCSPGTNTGNNAYNSTTIDILGNARLVGGTIDRGAFENTTGLPSTIVMNTADSGAGSLRTIIADACSGNTITFSNTLLNQTILLTGPQIDINKNLIIDGLGMDQLTISANGTHRHFNHLAGFTSTIKNLKLTEGNSGANAGNCITNQGNLTLQNILLLRQAAAPNTIILSNTTVTGITTIGNQVFMQ